MDDEYTNAPSDYIKKNEIQLSIHNDALSNFSNDVEFLWCGGCVKNSSITILNEPPDGLTFLRDYVSKSKPCIIRNAITKTDRSTEITGGTGKKNNIVQDVTIPLTMNLEDLVSFCPSDQKLTVDITPDGHGDCIRTVKCRNNTSSSSSPVIDTSSGISPLSSSSAVTTSSSAPDDSSSSTFNNHMFVKPEERTMTISAFRRNLRRQQQQKEGYSNEEGIAVDEEGLQVFPLSDNNNGSSSPCADGHNGTQDGGSSVTTPLVPPLSLSIVYYSRQNDCLRTEFSALFAKNIFPKTFHWAEEAFNNVPPDAINLWIGNECSVSSMHKDFYENLFYVLSGQKEFLLCPPCDIPFLYDDIQYDSGRFRQSSVINNANSINATTTTFSSSWCVVPEYQDEDVVGGNCNDENSNNDNNERRAIQVQWIRPDVEKILLEESDEDKTTDSNYYGGQRQQQCQNKRRDEYLNRYPLLRNIHPMKIHLNEGEMLYLPALWFHRVTQTCETIGINYWYDMDFNSPLYCYFNLLQQSKAS